MIATISTYKGRGSQWVEARVLTREGSPYRVAHRVEAPHYDRSKAVSEARAWARENGYKIVTRRELDNINHEGNKL